MGRLCAERSWSNLTKKKKRKERMRKHKGRVLSMQKTVAKHKEEQNEPGGLLRALLDLFVMILDKHLCRTLLLFAVFEYN